MSARDEAAVEVVKGLDGHHGTWHRLDLYAWAHAHGGTRRAFDALARAIERGWVAHHPRLDTLAEAWTLTENGRRRASR